jgi:hypothetical protein
LLPLAAFFFYFNSVTDSREALRALFRAWEPVFNSDSVGIPFYQAGAGLDTPWFHISRMAIEFGVLALITVICGWRLGRPTLTSIERIVLFVAVGAAGINYDWHRAGHSLPVLILCAAVLLWFESRSSPGERIRREATLSPTGGEGRGEGALGYMEKPQLIFPALWLVLSLFLMAKMGLNTRIEHYGVFLTMPACLSVVYLLLHLVPRFIERRGFVSRYFRIAMLILLLTGFARLIIQSALFYRDKDLPLGPPGDRIVTYNPGVDPTGAAMAAAVDWIETNTAPTNTLAVLPEGVMLNYLTRRSNPTPHVVFLLEVSIYGEHTMLEAFRKTPPDYIVLVHRESTEFGASYFGLQEGHGLEIMQWVNQNYETVHLIGSEPLKTKDFGIKILRKSPGRLATTSK